MLAPCFLHSSPNGVVIPFPLLLVLFSTCHALTASSPAPNILVCLADTQSYAHTSMLTPQLHTPTFEWMAREGSPLPPPSLSPNLPPSFLPPSLPPFLP